MTAVQGQGVPVKRSWREPSIMPGFGLTAGYTILYLSLIVLLPLTVLLIKAANLTFDQWMALLTNSRVLASLRLSFGGALIAGFLDTVLGMLVAWVLVRYDFPGRKLADALVDLPFALPTAVAGIALTAIYATNGWVGSIFYHLFGIRLAYTPIGVVIAMTFIGLPFVVRTVEPILQDLEQDVEEAAASLGANRLQTFIHVLLPSLGPALAAGFSLATARAVGEYGSVIFIAGNMPGISEIAPLLIVTKLEQYDYNGAAAIAVIMLAISFSMLLVVNLLSRRSRGGQV